MVLGLAGQSLRLGTMETINRSSAALPLQCFVATEVGQAFQYVVQIGMNAASVVVIIVDVIGIVFVGKMFALNGRSMLVVVVHVSWLFGHRWVSEDVAIVGTVRSSTGLTRRAVGRSMISTAGAATSTAIANHYGLLFHKVAFNCQRGQQAIKSCLATGHFTMIIIFWIIGGFTLRVVGAAQSTAEAVFGRAIVDESFGRLMFGICVRHDMW